MKPHVVGSPCHQVMLALDEALKEGELHLPPDLEAHAGRCHRCGPEYFETQQLLNRLREGIGQADSEALARLAADVLQRAESVPVPAAPVAHAPVAQPPAADPEPTWRWVVGQLAAVAAALLIAISGLTYTALKVNEVVSGTKPVVVVERMFSPIRDLYHALVPNAR